MPLLGQNEPTGHTLAIELPAGQYVVELHCVCWAEEEPAGQT